MYTIEWYSAIEKHWNPVIWDNMNEPEEYYVKLNKILKES